MNRWIMSFYLVCLGVFLVFSGYGQPAQPFTPGNLVLVDAGNDRLIEVELNLEGLEAGDYGDAEVVQEVEWPLGDTSRRRPLGMAFDSNGTAYVGITGVPTSATEEEEFPEGRGEILRILPDGSIDFTVLSEEVTKGTWVSSFDANEVFVMSNEPPSDPSPSHSFRFRYSGDEIVDTTLFNVSEAVKDNGSLSSGKALVLPDGRVMIPSEIENVIRIYESSGGDPVDQIETEKAYRSLAYLEDSDELLAIPGTSYVDRLDMEGNILGTFEFSMDGLGGVWNFTLIPDGSERFIATNHNGPADSNGIVFVYDSTRLEELPLPTELTIVGLDSPANNLFDHAIVPEPTEVGDWSIH